MWCSLDANTCSVPHTNHQLYPCRGYFQWLKCFTKRLCCYCKCLLPLLSLYQLREKLLYTTTRRLMKELQDPDHSAGLELRSGPIQSTGIMFVNDVARSHSSPCPPSCPTSTITTPRYSTTDSPQNSWDLPDKVLLSPPNRLMPLRRSSSVNIPLIKQSSAVPEILREDYVGYIRDSGPCDVPLKTPGKR